jgi:HEAT repeat protein
MPLVRKPTAAPSVAPADARGVIEALGSPVSDTRWTAARAAAAVEGADQALAQALQTEQDTRVREAMLTSLARIGTSLAVSALISILRSDQAAYRVGALDVLRSVAALPAVLAELLRDADPDVRILSCELARALPAELANRLLCELIDQESSVNVCAAAIDVLAEVGTAAALASLATCAERFRSTPFLHFAIETVSARIRAETASARD